MRFKCLIYICFTYPTHLSTMSLFHLVFWLLFNKFSQTFLISVELYAYARIKKCFWERRIRQNIEYSILTSQINNTLCYIEIDRIIILKRKRAWEYNADWTNSYCWRKAFCMGIAMISRKIASQRNFQLTIEIFVRVVGKFMGCKSREMI